jgi:YegS/Rv2252/BmrU family lipid kinase
MKKRIFAIVNPRAASYLAGHKWQRVQKELRTVGFDVISRFTERRFHAAELARSAATAGQTDIILSVGGDGTFNEIVNGLMPLGRPPENLPVLGIVSVGTGSDLARSLKITGGYQRAVQILKEGFPRFEDVGCVRFALGPRSWIRYFANVFDVGLGGNVVRIANFLPKNLGGFLTFLLSSLGGLLTFKPFRLRIKVDGRFADAGRITIAGCANGEYFGGGMDIAPMARLDDGRLELLYVKDANLFQFIRRVLIPVYDGRHLGYEKVFHRPARRVEISGDRVFLCDIDGEEEKAETVEVTVIPRALRIMAPPLASPVIQI